MLLKFLSYLLFLAFIVRAEIESSPPDILILVKKNDSSEMVSVIEKEKDDLKPSPNDMNQPETIKR
jgi:hypothetical protein